MRGYRSNTPEKIIEVRMLDMFIWNWVMFEANADRATGRSTFGASAALARAGLAQAAAVDTVPERIPVGVPERLEVRRVGDVEPPQGAALDDALDLGDGRLQRIVRNRREPDIAVGVRRAEIGEPLVVDAQDFDRRLRIVHAAGGAEDTAEHLGLHAAPILILEPEIVVGDAPYPAFAVLVEAGRRHAIGAMDAPGDVLPACRGHAARQPETGALVRDPDRPLRAVLCVRHPLLERRGRAGREEV